MNNFKKIPNVKKLVLVLIFFLIFSLFYIEKNHVNSDKNTTENDDFSMYIYKIQIHVSNATSEYSIIIPFLNNISNVENHTKYVSSNVSFVQDNIENLSVLQITGYGNITLIFEMWNYFNNTIFPEDAIFGNKTVRIYYSGENNTVTINISYDDFFSKFGGGTIYEINGNINKNGWHYIKISEGINIKFTAPPL